MGLAVARASTPRAPPAACPVASSAGGQGVRDPDCSNGRPNVVDAHRVRPRNDGGDGGGDRSFEPLIDGQIAEDLSDEALARGPDQDARAEPAEVRGVPQEIEIVLERLPKSDPGIDQDPVPVTPASSAARLEAASEARISPSRSS